MYIYIYKGEALARFSMVSLEIGLWYFIWYTIGESIPKPDESIQLNFGSTPHLNAVYSGLFCPG